MATWAILCAMRLFAALAVAGCSSAVRAPPHGKAAAFDGVFRAGAKQSLRCTVESTGVPSAQMMPQTTAIGCTTDRADVARGIKRAHVTCSGELDSSRYIRSQDNQWLVPGDPVTLLGTEQGIWRSKDFDTDVMRTQRPLIAYPPKRAVWTEYTPGDPYSGVRHFTIDHGDRWCAVDKPFGLGGATYAFAMCFSTAGSITGLAAVRRESAVNAVRCGETPEAPTLLELDPDDKWHARTSRRLDGRAAGGTTQTSRRFAPTALTASRNTRPRWP